MKLSEKLDRIREATPKCSVHGQLYSNVKQTRLRYSRVTLITLFRSDENTHLIRDHVFDKSGEKEFEGRTHKIKARYMSAKEWAEWFAANLEAIHVRSVLPGIALRTSKHWQVERIIGWIGDAKYTAPHTKLARKRHKAKSQRRKNG